MSVTLNDAITGCWRILAALTRYQCIAFETKLRTPGVEPGSQAWEACMMPLHYVRSLEFVSIVKYSILFQQ